MQKQLSQLGLLFLSLFALVSCSDSHEKLADDQIEYLEDMVDILNQTADGDLSSSEAVEKIREWGRKGETFVERKKALNKDMSLEELLDTTEKIQQSHGQRIIEVIGEVSRAREKLRGSGRLTHEIQDALRNVKNH